MRLHEFVVGNDFCCQGQVYKCTDVGGRVVVAIQRKEGWEGGPPYALPEIVFDEDDQSICNPIAK